MRISAVIDKNIISGTILLDSIVPLDLKLIHEISHNGVKNYIILESVTVQPNKKYFDYSFLNPPYYTNLFVDVNGERQEVLDPQIEYTTDSNPTNDRIYVESEMPLLDDVVIEEIPIAQGFQDFGTLFSTSSVTNLLNMANFKSASHIVYDATNRLRFDVTKTDVIISNDIIISQSPEITISVQGDKPDQVRLYLINARGEERLVSNFHEYLAYGNHNYSAQIVSSTMNARLELVYLKNQYSEFRSIKIQNIIVGRISQYFGQETAVRKVESVTAHVSKEVMYTFATQHFPMFGLRTLLTIGDTINKHIVQISNGKVLFKKVLSDETELSVISSSVITNPLKVSVYVSDIITKIYIDDIEVKSVINDLSIPIGDYTAFVGASELDQDYDTNAPISFSIYDRNLY